MRIYVDFRCLQDRESKFRGVGLHTASILRYAKNQKQWPVEMVGILDEKLDSLPPEYASLADTIQYSKMPRPSENLTAFIQPAPMSFDGSWCAPLIGRTRILSCAIVYDFIPWDVPRYLGTPQLRKWYLNNLLWLKNYNLYCPISDYTARRLREELNTTEASIAVTGCPIRPAFANFSPSQISTKPLRTRFRPGQYFVMVGGSDRRKNAECALVAHARLNARLAKPVGLIVAGRYVTSYEAELRAQYHRDGGDAAQVEFPQDLTDQELAALYHKSIAVVCPSQIEGFSLPVIEAIACSSPVLASDNDAQRELVLQPEALFNADDHDRLAHLMERMIHDPAISRSLVEQQAPMASKFTESEVARRFWNHLRLHADRRRTPAAISWRTDKPRVAFLTPYPPDRSGVADYTAASLKSIAEHATVDVFTDAQGHRADPWVRKFQPISQWPYIVDEYDSVVAVLGNSHFHNQILEFHSRHGGPCLVHDNRLMNLHTSVLGLPKFATYATHILGRCVSPAEAHYWLVNPKESPSIFFDEVLVRADPLIVHSRGIQARVADQYGRQSQYLPFCCYRHFKAAELTDAARHAARQRLALKPKEIIVATFGLVDYHKGCLDCIEAIGHLRKSGVPAELHFVGSAGSEAPVLQATAERLGVADHVKFVDKWISDDVYRDYMIAADFAIQLRTHGFGGLSGALLDCISAGLPTVANDDLATAMNGPDYVFRVPDSLDSVLIAQRLEEAFRNGRHLTRCCPERDNYVLEHSFDRYAVQMMQVLGLAG